MTSYGPLNIVNVNGAEKWVDDTDSFLEFLDSFGISRLDATAYLEAFLDDKSKGDGVWGDDYYTLLEHVHNEAGEVAALADALDSPSRKGNTRADIARSLRAVASNLDI